jgi:hypothetical protein
VHATNRTCGKAQPLIERGLRWQDSPRTVAAAADVVISLVTDDSALQAITRGPDGLVAGLTPGAVYVDMSSVSPHASTALAGQVRTASAAMLDAPVSGSVPQAEQGNLAIMVGGDEAAFRTVEPMLAQHRVPRLRRRRCPRLRPCRLPSPRASAARAATTAARVSPGAVQCVRALRAGVAVTTAAPHTRAGD